MTVNDPFESLGRTELRETLEENIGMSSSEAEVYLTLVRFGKQSMSEIAGNSDVPKQRVYNVVDDLRDDEYVEVVDEYPKKAYAIDPTETITPLIQRLQHAESELESLYDTVEDARGGVNLFKSRASVKKHIRNLIEEAEESINVLLPQDEVERFREDLLARDDVRIQLIVSNLRKDQIGEETVSLDESCHDLADRVRGIKSNESFVLIADREDAFFWTDVAETGMTSEEQGFHITNPELAFLLDRFVDQSIWPLAKPVQGVDGSPTFPQRYIRMRDCLIDLQTASRNRSVESFAVEFEGYDVETREPVQKHGKVTGYHYSKFDVRAYLELDLDDSENGTVTVGGWKATLEDYEARAITVTEREERTPARSMDDETADHLAACREALPETLDGGPVTFGFDGFVDNVREMVDVRRGPDEYDRLDSLEEFGQRITRSAAGDTSLSTEWIQSGTRCGGHAAHVSRAFARLGYEPTLVGAFGRPIREEFRREFGDHELHSFGEPIITDAVEFADGKLLLQKTETLPTVDWEFVCDEVGLETVAAAVDGAEILGIGYWANIPAMATIWDGLREDLWPLLSDPPSSVFVDSADVRQLSRDRLRDGAASLARLDDLVPVTVSANYGETVVLSDVSSPETHERSLPAAAEHAREELGVTRFAAHSPVEAALATAEATRCVDVPRTDDPELTTSAGDHFNAGLLLAETLGIDDGAALVLGNALAGWFVRNGEPPTYDQLRTFVSEYETYFE
ncbi:TrmB family transcriptional regulator [halophilic archaeon]|nr:TrmB family transcriptional regulator [halophilic archaeon]